MKGFTLIETLVAITILTLSIVGPLYSADRAIVAAQIARYQLTASYLAQEGIEYVRAVRDDEYLAVQDQEDAWDNFLDTSEAANCRSSDGCAYDPISPALVACSGACAPLYLLETGVYTPRDSNGAVTPFTRTIQVVDVIDVSGAPVDDDKRIISKVSWSFHGTPYSVTVTDHLTPWQ